jgi:hypothetical protein
MDALKYLQTKKFNKRDRERVSVSCIIVLKE